MAKAKHESTHEDRGQPEQDARRAQGEDASEPSRTAADENDVVSLRAERDEFRAKWQRAQADYQNLKRRSTADFEAISRRTMQPLLEELLRVLDHLDLALTSPATTEEARNLIQGVQLTRDQFMRVLEQEQVAPVPEEGTFDPAIHQAVGTVDAPEAEPGSIVQTVRRGYTWREGVLRHAQVMVAAGETGEEAALDLESDTRTAENEV